MSRAHVQGATRRLSARKVLGGAMKFVGRDVIVIGKTRGGDDYVASSLPCRSVADLDAQIALVDAALKRLRRYRTNQQRLEKANGEAAEQ